MNTGPLLLALSLFLAGCASAPVPDTAGLDAEVEKLLEAHRVPGASIALIRAGRVVHRRGYGLRHAAEDAPVGPETVFEACSMSKPVFAYLVMQLVDQGRIDLDKPLDSYLPAPYLPDQPAAGRITARMVLAHTTGLPNWRKGGWRRGKAPRLRFEPGEKFGYSGEGFLYLQRAVAAISGRGLAEHISAEVLMPFGMRRSGYVWSAALADDAARGHDKQGVPKTYRHYRRANAAYTLYTTPGDYARFLLEMSTPPRRSAAHISAASYRDMFRLQPVPDRGADPRKHRGLGWIVGVGPGGRFIEHSGANGSGFRCYARFDRERQDGFVFMTNGVNGRAVWEAVRAFIDAEGWW